MDNILWGVRIERSPNDGSAKTIMISGWDIIVGSFTDTENFRGPFNTREEAENCANVLLAQAGEDAQPTIY